MTGRARGIDAVSPPGQAVIAGARGQGAGPRLLRLIRTQPVGAFSALVLATVILVAVLASVISPYAPNVNNQAHSLEHPSQSHFFGTDQFGRDLFTRVLFGARISLAVGLGATLLAVLGATCLGLTSGYFGGKLDYLIQRTVDTVQSIPALVLLIAILVVLGAGLWNVIIALAVRGAITQSRIVRGSVLGIKSSPYLEAARVVGCSHWRIVSRYLLPNILPILIVLTTLDIGANITAEASLSFLGFGVPPPNPSWGGMMSAEGRRFMIVAPWILIGPTAALSLVVFSANMFGDAVRDRLDPRLRQR